MFYKIVINLFLFTFVFQSTKILPNTTTSYADWAICSPSKKLVQGYFSPCTYAELIKIGKEANQYWTTENDPTKLVSKLTDIFARVDHYFLIMVIDEILNSDELLEEITKTSYRNVTGFLKIVLASGGKESWKLRLHIWEQKEKEYPHNHKWDFFSKIITGYLSQNMYQKTAESSDMAEKYVICEPVSLMPLLPDGQKACPCRDNYILAEKEDTTKSAYLAHKNTAIIGAGESYFMKNDLIHTISPGKHAISFVFTSENVTDNSEVFVPCNITGNDLIKYAPSITKEELIQELFFIKKVLSRLTLSSKYLPELIHPFHGYFNRNSNILYNENWRTNVLSAQTKSYVAQLTEDEKNNFKISSDNKGNVIIGQEPVAASTDYLFVLLDDAMYASPKNFAHTSTRLICHSSFTDYASVDSAGLLRFDDNKKLIKIEAYSGHYEPSVEHMSTALNFLDMLGVNTSSAIISNYQDRE